MGKRFLKLTITAALLLSAACTVGQTEVPGLTGPSELALSVRMVAVPDSISQDGASQAAVIVTVFDAQSKPCANVPLRMEMAVGGQLQDFGALTARTIVTGTDGKANVTYTAPPPPPPLAGGSGNTVIILATPSTSVSCNSNQPIGNFDASNRQQVSIRLVPPGVILPPAGSPTAAFTMSPLQAVQNADVMFDASTSTPGAGASRITSYLWNFGDGTPDESGVTVKHRFTSQQTFNVTLTVTNDRGLPASSRVPTPVGAPPAPNPPTPNFTFSPASPGVGDTVFFNGSTSLAAAGHTIVSYEWTFGDGGTASGVTVSHAFTTAGSYIVQLKVTDEAGQSATSAGTSVTAGSSTPPTADFTFSPASPPVGQQVVFDASPSKTAPGQTIVDVAWNFGDGTAVVHCPGDPSCVNVGVTNRISAHTFAFAAVFQVNLVVTDSAGRTNSKTVQVTVVPPGPTAVLFLAKSGGNSIQADGSGSTAVGAAFIQTYRFIWGDASPDTVGAASSVSHLYVGPGAHTVTLVVTDNNGRTGATSKDITTP